MKKLVVKMRSAKVGSPRAARMMVDRLTRPPIHKERFDEIMADLIREGIAEEFIGEHGETRYRLRGR